MSNRKIINAASTGGIGYYPVISSSTTDAYYDNVSLLLNGDVEVDSNFANVSLLLDGNVIADKSNNKAAVTVNGGVTASPVNKKFGTGSCLFDGSSGYLSIPDSSAFDLSSNTFTIEAWVYQTSNSGNAIYSYVVDKRGGGGTWGLLLNSGVPSLMYGAGMAESLGSTAIPLNTWTHIAASVSSGTLRMFINGIQTHTASSLTFPAGTAPVWIGRPNTYGYYFAGNIDDLRITKGVARYTSNFTPPVKALPSHEILDSSVYRLPVTAYGNARIDTATKKYGTGAMYFDGTGDYLTVPANSAFNFGTGDYTVEGWVYSTTTTWTLYDTGGSGANDQFSCDAGALYWEYSNTSGVYSYFVDTDKNRWVHVAASRSSGTTRIFKDGVLIRSVASSNSIGNSSTAANIGRRSDGYYYTNGYIDDLRITKGYARYTTNFTPPSASLPTVPPTIPADPWWGNVSLLLDGNTTDAYDPYWQNVSLMLTGDDFIDWSNQHNAITVDGTTTINTTYKKYGTGSIRINGVGNGLRTTSSIGNFGTNDLTIECWAMFDAITNNGLFHLATTNSIAPGVSGLAVGYYSNAWGIYYNGTYSATTISTAPLANTWFHLALVRYKGLVSLFFNGIQQGTSFTDSTTNFTDTFANIGWWYGLSTGGGQMSGYIDDFRITKGVARYTANFTPPTAALLSYKIQDRTQNNLTVTPYGNVQLSTDVMKNGTGSMFFGGGHVYFSNSDIFDLSAKDFTLEAWIYPVNFSDYGQIFSKRGSSGRSWQMYTDYGTGCLSFSIAAGSNFNSTSTPPLNSWSHAALSYTYSNTTARLFLNGVLVYTLTSASFDHKAENIGIGSIPYPDGSQRFYGCIDDARITKGYARYTQNFTPPSQSFATQYISTGYDANYADVSLLLNGNGTNGSQVFTDLSGTPKTITVYGNAQISTAVKKYGVGAMYFSGTRPCRLKSDAYASLAFGTSDFTIEMWVYQVSKASGYPRLINFNADYTTNTHALMMNTNDAVNLFRYAVPGNMGDAIMISTTTLSSNTWYHVAVTRSGTIFRLFVNGTQESTYTSAATVDSNATAYITIGDTPTMTASEQFNGYIDDLRITKGIARYTSNFTPPTYQLPTDTIGTVIDPLRSSTSLLLRGNGTNGSTSFTDESPNGLTVTTAGTSQISTSIKKYGTGAIYSPAGLANYISVPGSAINFGTNPFTIEFWIYYDNTGSGYGAEAFGFGGGNNTSPMLGIGYPSAGKIFFGVSFASIDISPTDTVPINTWTHIAISRDSNSLTRMFINGVLVGSATMTSNFTSNTDFNIGHRETTGPNSIANRYIDDFRVTKGYARYTANFTPPTYEDPIVTGTVYDYNYPQVSLLLNGDGTNGSTTFTDLSSSPKAVTAYGNAQISTTVKKFGTGSMYFDGSGDYLTMPYNSAFDFGIGDFTVEAWVNGPYASDTFIFSSGTNNGFFFGFTGGHVGIGRASVAWDTNYAHGATTNTWNHFAISRYNSTVYVFVNGVLKGSATNTQNYSAQNSIMYVGSQGVSMYLTGYIDDLRITKGVARYTQNFTPPTAPLPTSYS